MALSYSKNARNSMLLGYLGLTVLLACTPKQRDLDQLMQSDADGGKQGVGGQNGNAGSTTAPTGGVSTTQAGATSTGMGGSGATGGTSASGGQSAIAGQPSIGGATGAGGSTAIQGGSGGATSPVGGASGALGIGGATVGVGGATSGIGGVTNTGGASIGAGGNVASGGVPGSGGVIIGVGGVANTGGVVGAGGVTSCVPTGVEACNDGIDNDCNGTVDCPNVTGRFPEPGRAASGDDVWVQLTAPVKALRQVECRSGKPNLVGNKLWLVCDTTNPKALTVYSMGLAEAKLPENNGVTQFDFRFVYADGSVSDPRSIVYYAHNSLWDTNKGTSSLLCNPLQADSRYFDAARGYLASDAGTPTFAAGDAQLKNPFIYLRFLPPYAGNNFQVNTIPQEIKVLSLRHRFVIEPGKQMLLVTRTYQSTRTGTCEPARIGDRDTYSYLETTGTPPVTSTAYDHRHLYTTCEAIVLNKAGTGVCLRTTNGVIGIANANSNRVISFLQRINIPWPKGDPMMWHKLFDDRPSRASLDFFSHKCLAEDLVCRAATAQAPVLPDNNDPYFANP